MSKARHFGVCVLLVALSHAQSQTGAAEDSMLERGARIYSETCADCHGTAGQGVADAYEEPLAGDSSVPELAKLIADTMPEGDPEACVSVDADAVATYIFETFYGPAAQLKLNPPKRRLARLTGHQLRQSLGDLYTSFWGATAYRAEKGIRARYFNRARKEDGKVSFDRTDEVIDFDFGTEGPGQGVSANNYSVQWNTALRVDVTGRYELVVRSSCAFVMYFGGYDREFINNYVQSENRTEFRKAIHLTAGRVYPLKIDLQQRKRKTEQPAAKISLSWKTPYGVEQIIPAVNFANVHAFPTFPLQAKLPPDDRSYGYERGIAVDRQWDEATTAAAIEFADQVVLELWPWYRKKHQAQSADRSVLRSFLLKMVETAFRGPVSTELQQLYIDQQLAKSDDDHEVIRRVLLITLKSPRFLYPALDSDRTPSQRAANRLALILYDSLPADEWLLNDAKNGQLEEPHQIRDAARRMVLDWRVRGKTRQLMYSWLNSEHLDEISKDEDRFPGFDAELVSDLRDSFDRFLDAVVWDDASDFRRLFSYDSSFATARMGDFYGDAWRPTSESPGVQPTAAESNLRLGVLTHPYLMSGLAYQDSTSPIHRGVFLMRYVLGRTLRPPNEAFTPLSPDLHPDLTTRERVQLQTSPESCQVCHAKINGLGFVMENFDAVGRYQGEELGRAIDATGRYTTRVGEVKEFAGPHDLAQYLTTSEDAKRAFVVRAFQHFVKQPLAAYGLETEDKLLEEFEQNDCNIRKLLVEIAVVASTPY